MELFVILVNSFYLLTNVTKNFILDVAGSDIHLLGTYEQVLNKFNLPG